MKIAPFKLERYFAAYEFSVPYLLSCSDCEPLMQSALLEYADRECLDLWNNLQLSYTHSAGHPLLRAEIAKLYKNSTTDDLVVLTPEEGIFIPMNVLLNPGDHVICTYPGYQSLYQIAISQGCPVSKWMPDEHGKFNIPELFSLAKENTRLIVINFPHNPTGATISRQELDQIIEFASERNSIIFSDEMYRMLEYDEKDRLPSVSDVYENGISLSGLSKTFSLPGLRIGWVSTRNTGFLNEIISFKDYTTICSGAPAEILGIIGLRNKEKIIARNLEVIARNLEVMHDFTARHPDLLDWKAPLAGTIAFPKIRIDESVANFCRELAKEKGVMLLSSEVYEYDKKCVRIGFGRTNFPEVLEKFEEFVAESQKRKLETI